MQKCEKTWSTCNLYITWTFFCLVSTLSMQQMHISYIYIYHMNFRSASKHRSMGTAKTASRAFHCGAWQDGTYWHIITSFQVEWYWERPVVNLKFFSCHAMRWRLAMTAASTAPHLRERLAMASPWRRTLLPAGRPRPGARSAQTRRSIKAKKQKSKSCFSDSFWFFLIL